MPCILRKEVEEFDAKSGLHYMTLNYNSYALDRWARGDEQVHNVFYADSTSTYSRQYGWEESVAIVRKHTVEQHFQERAVREVLLRH